ncbi:hypothetical protein M3Y97_01068800 [Aphelenchoides bicaudatus]|nr:hypothetical protein M3Y97_01068800 [Aphelenchoides bicaudatus]
MPGWWCILLKIAAQNHKVIFEQLNSVFKIYPPKMEVTTVQPQPNGTYPGHQVTVERTEDDGCCGCCRWCCGCCLCTCLASIFSCIACDAICCSDCCDCCCPC